MKILIFLIGLLSINCEAAKLSLDKLSDMNQTTCDGIKARKKFEFILSSFTKVPPGTRVDRVSPYLDQLHKEYDFVADNWIKYLMAHWYFAKSDGTSAAGATPALKFFRDEGLPVGLFSHSYYHRAIIRTGDNSFILCDGDACSALKDPVTGKKIEKSDTTSVSSGEKLCRPYFVDGVDPDVEEFSKFPIGIEKICKQNLFSRERFAAATGFKGGAFLIIHYFSVPEREKAGLCKSMGLSTDCFKIPDVRALEVYQKDASLEIEQPFVKDFIDSNCGACLSNAGFDARNAFADKIKNDSHLKLEWETALSKDLFLKASTKITKKVDGDWISYRIEWDPTLFCKYGKDRTDLYTQ